MTRITPTIVLMTIIAAYAHAQETQFNLLRALKPKRDSGEPAFSIENLAEPLTVLSYHDAYMESMGNNQSMAVFVVHTSDETIIKMVNDAVERWRADGFQRFLSIAIVGPDNPNYPMFDALDSEIEMMAWYKRGGKWGLHRYIGVNAVKGIMDKMTKWISDKDALVR